jgi:hypothetical protein
MVRDMSIFQIGESPYQYGVHSNLGTDMYRYVVVSSSIVPINIKSCTNIIG